MGMHIHAWNQLDRFLLFYQTETPLADENLIKIYVFQFQVLDISDFYKIQLGIKPKVHFKMN